MGVEEIAPVFTPVVLTIAGSDSSAGAGIQADLKTLSALGVYGAAVITAITAQNSLGVNAVFEIPAGVVRQQLEAVLTDMPVRVIKTGLLGGLGTMRLLVELLPRLPLVLDPVMVAGSGDRLLPEESLDYLRTELLPRAALLTPNLYEAAVLLNTGEAKSAEQMRNQARALLRLGPAAVLLKGGHFTGDSRAKKYSTDILATAEGIATYTGTRIATENTRGTGCTLASAIAAGLARNQSLSAAVKSAKDYITAAIRAADTLRVGRGRGPLQHFNQSSQNYCEDNL